MKNENVHMQALHCKLDVVLIQILRYNCSETDYSFCENSPPSRIHPLPGCGFHPQTPSAPTIFFRSAAPGAHPQIRHCLHRQTTLIINAVGENQEIARKSDSYGSRRTRRRRDGRRFSRVKRVDVVDERQWRRGG